MNPDSRILANIIKNMANEDDPLTPLIDEYLLIRERPEFRKIRLKEVTIPLLARPRPPGRLSPSSLCGCERMAAFKFLGVQGKRRVDPDTELIFEDGNWRHHKWQTMFKDMELVLGRDRFRLISIEEPISIGRLKVAGHLDVYLAIFIDGEWVYFVLDIKGANRYSWDYVFSNQEPRHENVKQLLAYMRGKNCQKGMLLYDAKGDNHYTIFTIEFNDEDWKEVRRWCKRVLGKLESRSLPERHPECNRGTFLYTKCPYRGLCFGKASDAKVARRVFKDFPGVEEQWELGHEAMVEDD